MHTFFRLESPTPHTKKNFFFFKLGSKFRYSGLKTEYQTLQESDTRNTSTGGTHPNYKVTKSSKSSQHHHQQKHHPQLGNSTSAGIPHSHSAHVTLDHNSSPPPTTPLPLTGENSGGEEEEEGQDYHHRHQTHHHQQANNVSSSLLKKSVTCDLNNFGSPIPTDNRIGRQSPPHSPTVSICCALKNNITTTSNNGPSAPYKLKSKSILYRGSQEEEEEPPTSPLTRSQTIPNPGVLRCTPFGQWANRLRTSSGTVHSCPGTVVSNGGAGGPEITPRDAWIAHNAKNPSRHNLVHQHQSTPTESSNTNKSNNNHINHRHSHRLIHSISCDHAKSSDCSVKNIPTTTLQPLTASLEVLTPDLPYIDHSLRSGEHSNSVSPNLQSNSPAVVKDTSVQSTESPLKGQTRKIKPPSHLIPPERDSRELLTLSMSADQDGRYGFNVKGGVDQKCPVLVSRVSEGTPAANCKPRPMREGDQIMSINGEQIAGLAHAQIISRIKATKELKLVIKPAAAPAIPTSLIIPASMKKSSKSLLPLRHTHYIIISLVPTSQTIYLAMCSAHCVVEFIICIVYG